MDDALLMDEGDGLESLAANLRGQPQAGRPGLGDHLFQGDAVDVLHHQEGRAVFLDRGIEGVGDMGVIELDHHLGLALEAAHHHFTQLDFRSDHLDDPNLVQTTMTDLVDQPHAALAEMREDFVGALDGVSV